MARPLWKGGINFGLVYIPVNLYSAESHDELDFDLLDRRNLGRIRYKRVNEETGREVEWDDIVKGYQYAPDRYVTLTDEDFNEARLKSSPNIEIQEFVESERIHPTYFETPYYLAPGKGGEKGYVLLREALKQSKRAAVAKVVIRTKEHLGVVIPVENVLVLNTIRYDHELRKADELDIPNGRGKVAPKELNLAKKLIAEMEGEWRPEKFKDEYQINLKRIVKEKVRSGGKREPEALEEPKAPKVVDLMEMLRKSVEESGNGKRPRAKAGRKGRAAKRRSSTRKQAA